MLGRTPEAGAMTWSTWNITESCAGGLSTIMEAMTRNELRVPQFERSQAKSVRGHLTLISPNETNPSHWIGSPQVRLGLTLDPHESARIFRSHGRMTDQDIRTSILDYRVIVCQSRSSNRTRLGLMRLQSMLLCLLSPLNPIEQYQKNSCV